MLQEARKAAVPSDSGQQESGHQIRALEGLQTDAGVELVMITSIYDFQRTCVSRADRSSGSQTGDNTAVPAAHSLLNSPSNV
jgi:hypothetical protein